MFLRMPTVMRMTGLGRSTIYRLIAERKIPSPVRGRNVFRHHGRGIYLINQLMDEVSFERGGTEIRMLKR